MLYYYLFVALVVAAAYVWKYGRPASLTSWRKAINQNWALYRRRLLKRTRSQTPPVLFGNGAAEDQVPLIASDRLESVTSDGGGANGDSPVINAGLVQVAGVASPPTSLSSGVRAFLLLSMTMFSALSRDALGFVVANYNRSGSR